MFRQSAGATRLLVVAILASVVAGLVGCASGQPERWMHTVIRVSPEAVEMSAADREEFQKLYPEDVANYDGYIYQVDMRFLTAVFKKGILSRSIERGQVSAPQISMWAKQRAFLDIKTSDSSRPVVVWSEDDYSVRPDFVQATAVSARVASYDPETREGVLAIGFVVRETDEDGARPVVWYLPETELPFRAGMPLVFSAALPEGETRVIGFVHDPTMHSLFGHSDKEPMAWMQSVGISNRLPGEDLDALRELAKEAYGSPYPPLDPWPKPKTRHHGGGDDDDDDEGDVLVPAEE